MSWANWKQLLSDIAALPLVALVLLAWVVVGLLLLGQRAARRLFR